MTQYYFLSGIARSGSTLLGSILNQNPEIYVSPTSPLMDIFCETEQMMSRMHQQYTFDCDAVTKNIQSKLHKNFYENIDKKYIFDKHRGWPRNINTVKDIITPNPKIICTHRHIAENIVSFLKLVRNDPNNFVDRELLMRGMELSTYNRALCIWNVFSSDPFYSMKDGLENHRDCIHVVEYDDLINNTQQELRKIYEFVGMDWYEHHQFESISNTCAENDSKWGMKNLHTLRPGLNKTSDDPLEILGEELLDRFNEIERELSTLL